MLADQWRPPGDPPRRAVIDGRLAWVDKVAAELGVLDLFPETAVMQVGVVKDGDRFVGVLTLSTIGKILRGEADA